MKTLNKTEKVQTTFKEWSLSTSFHCYPKIFRSENVTVRLSWSICFMFFSILTFKLLYKSLHEYFEYDVVSKIRVLNEKSSPFPTVTICDANPFSTMYAESFLKNTKSQAEFFSGLNLSKIETSLIQMEYNKNTIMKQAFGLKDEEKRKLGFSLDQIRSCYFNELECNIQKDFYWFFSYKWGSCYQFNSGKNTTLPLKQTKLGGKNYGLGLFIGPMYNLNKYPTFHSTGLRIFVHNNSFLSSSADEILVEMGKHSSISIKKTITHKSPMPHSECQDLSEFKSDLYDYIKINHMEYRQKDCFEMCLQKIIIENCKCFYTWLPAFGFSLPPCFNTAQFQCLASKFNEAIDKLESICGPKCPLECNSVTYDLTMSSLSFPNKQFYNLLELNASEMSLEKFRRLHLGLDIFFPVKQYTEISETPKITFVDLVSSIGGALGVFLGLSVFSFIEIFEIIFHVLFLVLRKRENTTTPLVDKT
jgi:hypothetical protein